MEEMGILLEGSLQRQEIPSNSNRGKDTTTINQSSHTHGKTHKSVTRIVSLPASRQRNVSSRAVRLQRCQSYPPAFPHTRLFCDGPTPQLLGPVTNTDYSKVPNNCDDRTRLKEIQRGPGLTLQNHKQRGLASMRDSLPSSLESLEDVFVLVDIESSIFAARDSQLCEQGEEVRQCGICIADTSLVLTCCKMPICDVCVRRYIREKVNFRIITIACPNPSCNISITREEVVRNLSRRLHNRFQQFLCEENRDPKRKTCPNCNRITKFEKDVIVRKRIFRPDKYQVSCPCGLVWCFRCHAPWHKKVSCKQYQKGDRLLREWADERQRGQLNARKCPKCKVLIQREDGCNHMICSQCQTDFCYACGKRLLGLPLVGDHESWYSIFGCKKIFLPNNVVMRKAIRGTIFGCLVTTVGCVVILAVGLVIIGGIFLAPVYVPYLIRQRYYRRKSRQRQRQRIQWMTYRENTGGVR